MCRSPANEGVWFVTATVLMQFLDGSTIKMGGMIMEKFGIDCNITVTKDFRLVCQLEPSFNHAIPRSISAFDGPSLEEFYWLSSILWPRVLMNMVAP